MPPESHPLPFLRETLVFLTLAGLLIPLLQRFRVNQVLGFLAVGALFGPHGLGALAARHPWLASIGLGDAQQVASLAELGVLFLLFMIGLELSAERLWALRRWVFGAGSAQILGSAAVIGGIAWAWGNRPASAAILGLVLALSSTAVVMQLLAGRKALGSRLGQAVFCVLLMQDLAVVPVLVLVDVLGQPADSPLAGTMSAAGGGLASGAASAGPDGAALAAALGWALAKAVIAIAAIYVVGSRLLRPVFRTLLRSGQPDVFVALVLLSTLGIAGLTWAAGLSLALGAFLAGVLLAETEYRHEVEVTVEPFKGLLMGLFFMSIGMGVDLRALAADPLLVPLSVAGLFAFKALVGGGVLMAAGLPFGRAVEGGLLLGQGGEFAFIVVGAATAGGLLSPEVGRFMTSTVALSMFATPFVAKAGERFGDAWERRRSARRAALAAGGPKGSGGPGPGRAGRRGAAARELEAQRDAAAEAALDALDGHVLIAGFGRVGRLLSELLEAQRVPYVAVESDAGVVGEHHRAGRPVYFGNAARVELLRRLHVERAAAVVLTMDHPAAALHAVAAVRQVHPRVRILVRARDEGHAAVLLEAGADVVIPETLEAGLQLGAGMLQALGVAEPLAARIVDDARAQRIASTRLPAR